MKHTLSTQISLGFSAIVLAMAIMISLTANFLINHQFEQYVGAQQKEFSAGLANGLSDQYDSAKGTWNLDYIHGFGMYALSDGYILKLYDTDGEVIWDAQNHDMTLCHQVMNRISLQMKEQRPELKGDFVTTHYELKQLNQLIGYVDISYYSPYYFNENAFHFVDSLNQILIMVSIVSIFTAIAAGTFFAKKITSPIVKATEVAREIAKGNYEIHFESDVQTEELQELTRAVNHMALSLSRQEHLRRRLTTDVAHELRTPLTNVSSHLEAILLGVWEPTKERLQSCYNELQRISSIVSDLEKLRQIETENMSLNWTPVDLLELSQSAVSSFEPELQKKHLTCRIYGSSLTVSGDQERLFQAVLNLLSNAVKYSNENGQICIRLQASAGMGIMTVEDHGIGIASEDLPLIFERFYRTDLSRTRKTGGAGIGLTITKAIIEAHGGTISVESAEGKGSKFTISLPL